MVTKLHAGGRFEGNVILRIHPNDDEIERAEARRPDGTKALLYYLEGGAERADAPRDVALKLKAAASPRLPAFYEARSRDDAVWALCEYPPEERKLSTVLQAPYPSLAEALALVDSVAAVLETASRLQLVHGRLRPGLIWIDERGRLKKVYDLGIGELFGLTGAAPRRLSYASPERLSGAPPSVPGDIYALSAILYAMLAGHPPYSERVCALSPERRRELILSSEPPERVGNARPGVPGHVDDFVARALSKKVDERFVTWPEFREELQRVAARYLRDEPRSGPISVVPDSKEPSDTDRLRRDTEPSAIAVWQQPSEPGRSSLVEVVARSELPRRSPAKAPVHAPVELPPTSPTVVEQPDAPAPALPTSPALPRRAPEEIPTPAPAPVPPRDERVPALRRRRKQPPLAAMGGLAITLGVVLVCLLLRSGEDEPEAPASGLASSSTSIACFARPGGPAPAAPPSSASLVQTSGPTPTVLPSSTVVSQDTAGAQPAQQAVPRSAPTPSIGPVSAPSANRATAGEIESLRGVYQYTPGAAGGR